MVVGRSLRAQIGGNGQRDCQQHYDVLAGAGDFIDDGAVHGAARNQLGAAFVHAGQQIFAGAIDEGDVGQIDDHVRLWRQAGCGAAPGLLSSRTHGPVSLPSSLKVLACGDS